MQRRKFLTMLVAGGSLLTTRLFPKAKPKPEITLPPRHPDAPGRILSVKGEYYRHYPVDFSRGVLGAQGFKGWGESVAIRVPLEQTALVPMHIWNVDLHPALKFSPQGDAGPVMAMLE